MFVFIYIYVLTHILEATYTVDVLSGGMSLGSIDVSSCRSIIIVSVSLSSVTTSMEKFANVFESVVLLPFTAVKRVLI